MSNTTERTIVTAPTDAYVDLPEHTFVNGTCAYCGDSESLFEPTYEAYVARWERDEWEGERGHTPWDREEWDYLKRSCLS